MKQQKITRSDKKKSPTIIDDRPHKAPEIPMSPESADIAVRAVFYVEVGDMDQIRVQLLVSEVSKLYTGLKGGAHYVIPIRHGKITSDIVFEEEFLKVVEATCEVKDGKIGLKDGTIPCHVIRHQI